MELQSREAISRLIFLTTIMHVGRYHVLTITHASSGYKSQRRDRARRRGKEREHKENRGRIIDLKIHRKQKTKRRKNRGRTEEESSFDLLASPS